MTIAILFQQLKSAKSEVKIPIILMGYINPVLSFGFEKFCKNARIQEFQDDIPDLPPIEFEKNYKEILKKYHLNFTFLVTPETSEERIKYLDSLSSGFLYAVSSSSTTGNETKEINKRKVFRKIIPLKPRLL